MWLAQTTCWSAGNLAGSRSGPDSRWCVARSPSTSPATRTWESTRTTTWSQTRSRSDTTCEESSTLISSSATASISTCRNSRRASGSRLATGSSRTSSSGRFASPSVSASWARWPPESWPARWPGSRPRRSIRRRAAASSQRGLRCAPRRRWSATVSPAYVGVSWATKPTFASWAESAAGRPPQTSMVPTVGVRIPTIRLSSVVLPAPFGPTRPVTRPTGMSRVQSRSAHRRRYCLPRPRAVTMALTRSPRSRCERCS